MVPILGNIDGRRNGEENTRPGQKYEVQYSNTSRFFHFDLKIL